MSFKVFLSVVPPLPAPCPSPNPPNSGPRESSGAVLQGYSPFYAVPIPPPTPLSRSFTPASCAQILPTLNPSNNAVAASLQALTGANNWLGTVAAFGINANNKNAAAANPIAALAAAAATPGEMMFGWWANGPGFSLLCSLFLVLRRFISLFFLLFLGIARLLLFSLLLLQSTCSVSLHSFSACSDLHSSSLSLPSRYRKQRSKMLSVTIFI